MLNFVKIFLAITILFSQKCHAKEILLRLTYSDHDASPWQIGDGEAIFNPPGLSVDIIKKAAKNLGYKVILSRVPTNRVLNNLKLGITDGAFIYSYVEDRAESAAYPMKGDKLDHERRIATLSYYFYKNKNSPAIWNGKTILNNNTDIGVARGYAGLDLLHKMNLAYEESKGIETLVRKVQSERLSICLGQSMIVEHFIKKLKADNLIKLEPAVAAKDYFLLFSHQFVKKNKDIAEKFWTQIGKIRDTETEKLLKYYEKF